jgi:hypothetical protein
VNLATPGAVLGAVADQGPAGDISRCRTLKDQRVQARSVVGAEAL